MSYLTRLSAHTLKIDQSLVRGVEAGSRGGMLVSNIVQMGRDLGYRIVAEGIETEDERALLAGWGCDYGQGWHFGRPMSAGVFADWFDGGRGRPPNPRRRRTSGRGRLARSGSALRELEAAARLALAVLLALDDAAVAGQEAGGLQRRAQRSARRASAPG